MRDGLGAGGGGAATTTRTSADVREETAVATGTETERVERRGDKDRRRGGSVVGPAVAIIAGAGVLAGAASLVPLAAAISTGMIALVWWSLLNRKPHVRRTELLASGGGAAVVLWLIVFALPHFFGVFRQEGPARDSQGELLELPPDLQPAPVEPDRLAWLDNMAAVGVVAAIGLCMVGWGWRTLRRRRGRRRRHDDRRAHARHPGRRDGSLRRRGRTGRRRGAGRALTSLCGRPNGCGRATARRTATPRWRARSRRPRA